MSLPSQARVIRLISMAIVVVVLTAGTPPGAGAPRVQFGHAVTEATPSDWAWPVSGPRRILAPYRAPPTPYGAGHRGIDVAVPASGEIVAPADGVVHFAGMVAGRPVVSLRHAGGFISSVEPVDSSLALGERVARGEPIGVVWHERPHCATSCIHLGVRLHGEYISPLTLLGGIPRSVLLPTRSVG